MTEAVALTFDDGPSEWTEAILDVLAAHDVAAAFFVVGHAIGGRERTLARMANDGHQVGNHTLSHPRMTGLDPSAVRGELEATCRLIEQATGEWPTVWRPPYFDTDSRVEAIAREFGLAHIGAAVTPDDWSLNDPAEIADRVVGAWRPAAIVCLHDGVPPGGGNGTSSRQATVDAVRLILGRLA